MKVAVYSIKSYEKKHLDFANNNKHQLAYIEEPLSVETVSMSKGNDAVAIFANDDACSEVINQLNDLNIRFIAVRAAGYDNVQLKKASEFSIKIANVPVYSPNAIAEHAVTLILALNRKIILSNNKVKSYNFLLDDLIGFDLNGKTVGIVGLGNIGSIVAKILHGFGCKLLGFDININKELAEKYSLKYCSLDDLFKQSDIISLHTPLNEHTKHLINKNSLTQMKKGVMIINTGRGGLINTSDIIEALKSEQVGYLGMDVYEFEKGLYFHDHSNDILQDDYFARLLAFKNVLLTGHHAFLTEDALKNIADTTIYNLDCWEKGKKSEYELI